MKRLNILINDATESELKEVCKADGRNMTETVRRAISVYNFLIAEKHKGSAIMIAPKDGGESIGLVLM